MLRLCCLIGGLLLALPVQPLFADDAAPSLDCTVRSLPIGAAEYAGLRVQCGLTGAPLGDSQFSLVANLGDLPARTVCSGNLTGGAGSCMGIVLEPDTSDLSMLDLVATLAPSGATAEFAPNAVDQ